MPYMYDPPTLSPNYRPASTLPDQDTPEYNQFRLRLLALSQASWVDGPVADLITNYPVPDREALEHDEQYISHGNAVLRWLYKLWETEWDKYLGLRFWRARLPPGMFATPLAFEATLDVLWDEELFTGPGTGVIWIIRDEVRDELQRMTREANAGQ